jgi:hypothetical protein
MENVYIPYNDVGEYYPKLNSQEIGNEVPKFHAPLQTHTSKMYGSYSNQISVQFCIQ